MARRKSNKQVKAMMESITGGQFVTWPWDGVHDFNCDPKFRGVVSIKANQEEV